MHCRDLSFDTYYSHIKAHQDNQTAFQFLSRTAQLNCICNHAAKFRIAKDSTGKSAPAKMFPLEPVGVYVQGEKMTSNTGRHIQYQAHYQLARTYYQEHNLLSHKQFNAVDWKSVYSTLHDLPRLFQLWASKHVLGIAGTMKFLSHQDGQSPLCPSCHNCNKTCKHIACWGNGYSVLLAVCSAICPASFGHVLSFCMGQNILVNEWIFYAIHL